MGQVLLDRRNIHLKEYQSNCKLYCSNNYLLIRCSIYVDRISFAYMFNTIAVWCAMC